MGVVLVALASARAAVLAVTPDAGTIAFELPASLHLVEGRAPRFDGRLDTSALTGALTVDAASLTTGLGPRDSRMTWHCLDATRFPTIALAVARIEGAVAGLRAGSGSGAITLEGALTIRDVTRSVVIAATYAWEGDALRLKGRHPLSWADWNVPDPSILLSTVSPQMTVSFDVLASPS